MNCRKDSLIIMILLCLQFWGCAEVPDPRLFVENSRAIISMNNKNYGDSREHFIAALQFDPFRGELHTNLGLAFQLSQDPDKALQSFKKAEELSTAPLLQFVNRYNQGQLLGAQTKIDEALIAYQKALELHPGSIEVKTNIELMIQSQQQEQQGEGEGKDKDKSQNDQDNKDQKKGPKEGEDKDQKKNSQDDKKESKENKQRKAGPKYQPREFKGEFSQNDVNKILNEIKAQEQKIRAQFNKNENKEKPRDKDW